jgi:hypothetical protein
MYFLLSIEDCLAIPISNAILFCCNGVTTFIKNEVDQHCKIMLGFLLDTNDGTWEIFNSEEGEKLCVIQDIDCAEALLFLK